MVYIVSVLDPRTGKPFLKGTVYLLLTWTINGINVNSAQCKSSEWSVSAVIYAKVLMKAY